MPPEPPDSAAERRFLFLALGIALLATAARGWMAWATHSTTEDFLITLRYAENIAAGSGFVYNPGERVLGTTTPLYTLLLALAAWTGFDAALLGKSLNIGADGLTCFLLARLLARPEIGRPVAGLFAAVLYAFGSTPLSISIGGMETGLVTCVCMGMIHAYAAGRAMLLYVLGALLFLLRIDGLLLFGLLAAGLALRERRIPWGALAVALLIALPWLVFAFVYFGSPIPTSFLAKVTIYGSASGAWRNLEAFRTQFALGGQQRILTGLFLIGALQVAWACLPRSAAKPLPPESESREAPPLQPEGEEHGRAVGLLGVPLLWLCLYYGTMLASPVPAFAWYFLPPWPLFLGVALLGANEIATLAARLLPAFDTSAARRMWPVALLIVGTAGLLHLRAVQAQIAQAQRLEDEVRRPIGLWLRERAAPQERILLEPIGTIGYYSRRPILDMIGLVSPEVFPSYRAPHPLADMIRRFRPEWLCLRPGEAALLSRQDAGMPGREYAFVRAFGFPNGPPEFLLYRRKNTP